LGVYYDRCTAVGSGIELYSNQVISHFLLIAAAS
jgi:hypothetical protein